MTARLFKRIKSFSFIGILPASGSARNGTGTAFSDSSLLGFPEPSGYPPGEKPLVAENIVSFTIQKYLSWDHPDSILVAYGFQGVSIHHKKRQLHRSERILKLDHHRLHHLARHAIYRS
jgi:hypothetical protein